MPQEILGSYRFPLDDPNFATRAAFEAFLNKREADGSELIAAVGFFTDPATGKPAGHFYEYRPLPLELSAPAQPLHVLPVHSGWEQFLDAKIDQFEFIDRAEVILGGTKIQVALVRERSHPIVANADDADQFLTTSTAGWEWLRPKIVGDDLVFEGVKCTWFGGPHDRQDSGETASGQVNTRRQTDFLGCALPMSGFRRSRNTAGSPIPRFRWLTPVEVTCIEDDLDGRQVRVELIDLGPARSTGHALDLTEAAFNRLGAASRRGVVKVNFRIPNWREHLEPGATFSLVPGSSSEQKPLDAGNLKIRLLPEMGAWDADGFRAFIASLKLANFSADEMLPYFLAVKHGVKNSPPPPALWPNIAPTLLILDRLRTKLGVPVHITSSYRSPAYNRQCEGAAGLSQHMAFRATDIQVTGVRPRDVHRELTALRGEQFAIPAGARFSAEAMVNNGDGIDSDTPFDLGGLAIDNPTAQAAGRFVFQGGIGLYETFVHVDCRGSDANWLG